MNSPDGASNARAPQVTADISDWPVDTSDPGLARRRQMERGHLDTRVFGGGKTFFHPENSRLSESLLRGLLRYSGLLARGRRNAMDLRVRENPVMLPRLPAAFEGFRLLQISDLHLDSRPEFPPNLARLVANLAYDLCVLTGDYCFHTHGDIRPAMRGLAVLREALKGPVYAVLGNHDHSDMIPEMAAMGYQVLYNAAAPVQRDGESITLLGVDDPHFFQTDDLPRALAGVADDQLRVLLAHSPEIYRSAEAAEVDFMLCGHTHGGQIALPGGRALYINARCPHRLASGNWSYGALRGYTSVGAGSSLLDVRFNCQPEVVVHVLQGSCGTG